MTHAADGLRQPAANAQAQRLPLWRRSHTLLLALLAGQYLIWSVLTLPLVGDSPRNLHWGVLITEQPGFLLDTPDPYPFIKGFPPDPPELSARQLYTGVTGALHSWWGPLAPLTLAAVWRLTHSYLALQLVFPLAGAGAVLLTYALARTLAPPRTALLAAAFLACFPLFRDFASTAYSEAFSALMLTAALLAFHQGRTLPTVILGALVFLTKLDLVALYGGVVVCCGLYALFWRDGTYPLRHYVAALAGPFVIASPWVWVHYLHGGASGPTAGLSPALFAIIAPQMLELLFYIPWYGAVLALSAIGVCVAVAVRSSAAPRMTLLLLGSWFGLGVLTTLIYAATPGAGNSPRVVIPALPPLALLFALGFERLAGAWRRRIGFFLAALFVVVNLVAIGYYAVQGAAIRRYMPAWEVLRTQPTGVVLTEQYWATILFARQPATWFEGDPMFERNIMHDATHFARYVEQHPIRYVLLPQEGALASAEVRAYLDAQTQPVRAGMILLYDLRR